MNASDVCEYLMRELGPQTEEIDALVEHAGGLLWAMSMADGNLIDVEWVESPNRAVFTTPIGTVPHGSELGWYEFMLKYNGYSHETGGITCAITGKQQEAILMLELPEACMSVAQVQDAIRALSSAAVQWRADLEAGLTATAPRMDEQLVAMTV